MHIILSLCIIYNQNHMKKKLIWMRNNVLLTFMFAVLVVSVIMLGFYFYKFNSGFSANNEDWGGFGSYFASITGLLAFAGVLYTAWQSEQRANKAKEESIRRGERDLFFKLLDLYQRQVDSISLGEFKGVTYFKELSVKINQCMILYVALKGYKDHRSNFEGSNQFFREIATYFGAYIPDIPYRNIDFYLNNGHISDLLDYYSDAEVYGTNLMKTMNIEEIGQKMKYVADVIYNEDGYFLGQYYRTIFYLLRLTSGFKEKSEYYQIFRSQLSRHELLLLLYNVVSSQSTKEVKSLYKECDLFNNIIADDILGYVNWNKKEEHTVSDFIDQLLNS